MNMIRGKAFILTPLMLLFSLITVESFAMTPKGGAVVQIKSIEEFDRYLQSGNFIVAYFGAPWCGPCKAFHETYYAMAAEYPDVIFLEISEGSFPGSEKLTARFGVRSYPTFVFFDKTGTKKSSFSGTSDRTKAKIAGEIVQLKGAPCPQAPVSPQAPQQGNVQQAPMRVQEQPMVQRETMQQQMPSGTMTQQSMVQPLQPVVQQNVQPRITYHDTQNPEAAARQENQRNFRANQRGSRNVNQSRPRGLRRRQRQRMNNIEYQ